MYQHACKMGLEGIVAFRPDDDESAQPDLRETRTE
jgi:protein tyrosine phosphatase (PTP) superfamily phosphohydrolase (DUF442 family)